MPIGFGLNMHQNIVFISGELEIDQNIKITELERITQQINKILQHYLKQDRAKRMLKLKNLGRIS